MIMSSFLNSSSFVNGFALLFTSRTAAAKSLAPADFLGTTFFSLGVVSTTYGSSLGTYSIQLDDLFLCPITEDLCDRIFGVGSISLGFSWVGRRILVFLVLFGTFLGSTNYYVYFTRFKIGLVTSSWGVLAANNEVFTFSTYKVRSIYLKKNSAAGFPNILSRLSVLLN